MLFISRCVGRFSYGVVDTDDGSESITSKRVMIPHYVEDLGLDIKGVVPYRDNAILESQQYIIRPYQYEAYKNPTQAKLKMLKHVDIVTWRDRIADIKFDPAKVGDPVTIVLSDFGHIMCDRFLRQNDVTHVHKLTLILDDSLTVEDMAFIPGVIPIGCDGVGVMLDMRRCMNSVLVAKVYSQVLHTQDKRQAATAIIDVALRKEALLRKLIGD